MDPIELIDDVEKRYRLYLQTTFYFRDPALRASFAEALRSDRLSRGPYLEATPAYRKGLSPRELFAELSSVTVEEQFLAAVQGDRPLYRHQERAIRRVMQGRNIVVSTGTGSGKTEAFLLPVLLHLYHEFQRGELGPGVRALILYPMNALANDQRDRLGEICGRLAQTNARFRFTFGQYVGDTPEDERDSRRQARDRMAQRLPGELVLRSEMRESPPHILLTNYSMLEYLLLRPDDSPLFDNGMARWWTYLILDEAHQYRGSKGTEMAMPIRRLRQRLVDGGRNLPFRCIATSASLVRGNEDRPLVARFASDLFGESFADDDVILGETEPISDGSSVRLPLTAYSILRVAMTTPDIGETVRRQLRELAQMVGAPADGREDVAKIVGAILIRDARTTYLRRLISQSPRLVEALASEVFDDEAADDRVKAIADLIDLLTHAADPETGVRLLSARYHTFLRSLEGAFLTLWPKPVIRLDRKRDEDGLAFDLALCRECGQHYLVGRIAGEWFTEPVR
ncbi:MAG TPA: DEAD/DEAH box helicase, partial [Chloroflexota bacterium]|nr:DEAD/DEAH box helicase [Chloroflexota bacterium]